MIKSADAASPNRSVAIHPETFFDVFRIPDRRKIVEFINGSWYAHATFMGNLLTELAHFGNFVRERAFLGFGEREDSVDLLRGGRLTARIEPPTMDQKCDSSSPLMLRMVPILKEGAAHVAGRAHYRA